MENESKSKKSGLRLVVVFGIIIFLCVLGYFVFSANSKSVSGTATTTTVENTTGTGSSSTADTQSSSQGFTVVTLGANAVTEGGTSLSDTITNLGQTISGSNLWQGNPWSGNSTYSQSTSGQFIQIDLTMNNTGTEAETVETVIGGVTDQAGRYYGYSMGNSTCSGDGLTESDQLLMPDIPCVEHLLFETGQDSKSYTLKLDYKQKN